MDTTRDLVEAHSFSRRRLVTAFVSGASSGREVEPVRPARAIVAGLALGVLLIAGAAVRGVLTGPTEVGWNKSTRGSSPSSAAPHHPTRMAEMPPAAASASAPASCGRSIR